MSKRFGNMHDKAAKAILSDVAVARSFFEAHIPDSIKQKLDLDSLCLSKGSFVDKDLAEYLTDLLYQVNLGDDTAYIYLLIECQSSPDRLMPFRILQYSVKIMQQHLEKKTHQNLK